VWPAYGSDCPGICVVASWGDLHEDKAEHTQRYPDDRVISPGHRPATDTAQKLGHGQKPDGEQNEPGAVRQLPGDKSGPGGLEPAVVHDQNGERCHGNGVTRKFSCSDGDSHAREVYADQRAAASRPRELFGPYGAVEAAQLSPDLPKAGGGYRRMKLSSSAETLRNSRGKHQDHRAHLQPIRAVDYSAKSASYPISPRPARRCPCIHAI
jgi:hypothetical protein